MDTKLIRDTIEGIQPAKEKVDEIYEKSLFKKRELEKMEKQEENTGRLKKLLPLVAVFTIIISTTAFAYMGVDSIFLKYLNGRNIVNENLVGDIGIDNYIYNIDKEIENENGVLYIKQAIMDENKIFIYMSFVGKEDIDFTGANREYSFKRNVYNKQWYSEDEVERDKLMDEYQRIQDEGKLKVVEKGSTVNINGIELGKGMVKQKILEVDKNRINLVFSYDIGEELEAFIGGEMRFHFRDLGYYKTYQVTLDNGEVANIISDKFVPLVKGDWKGDIKLYGKLLPTKTYNIDKEIKYSTKDGTDAKIKITDIEISNVSLKINGECENNKDVDVITRLITEQAKRSDENPSRSGDIKLKNKSGKITQAVIDTAILSSSIENGKITVERSFDSPINLKELKSIIIWGEEIELK